jgi:hypothetical protein
MNPERPPEHPIRPRLVFRVGIVGHRWNRLGIPVEERGGSGPLEATADDERALRASCDHVLRRIASTVNAVAERGVGYHDRTARLTLVSGLAEGADRIAAHAALARGYELRAILPFDPTAYLADFDEGWRPPMWSRPGAQLEFGELLSRASDCIVMDGSPGDDDAYVALGRTLLHHADVLIGIWNREAASGAGGTDHVLRAARQSEIPIIRIDPRDPERPWLEDPREPDDGVSAELGLLDRRIRDLIEAPPGPDLREAYFQETFVAGYPGKAYGVMSTLIRDLGPVGRRLAPTALGWLQVFARIARPTWREHWVPATRARWEAEWSTDAPVDADLRATLVDALAAPYAWADNLATFYANRHRSAFTVVFSLAWIAAAVAVIGFAAHVTEHHQISTFAGVVELAVVGAITGLNWWGRRHHYHEKWIDYRTLAERLRHLTVIWPTGASVPFARMAEHIPVSEEEGDAPVRRSEDPRVTWVGWLYRATVRELGFATREFNRVHIESCRRLLVNHEIGDQLAFHTKAMGRLERIHRNIEARAKFLFGVAALVAAAHLVAFKPIADLIARFHPSQAALWTAAGLTLLSVFLPARAAALNGWAGHADFYGAALRSAQIATRLEELQRMIQTVSPLDSGTIGEFAVEATRVMESELLAWHTVSRSKPLPEG